MPENEFEKRVSSEMQDLKFTPSENVWLRVEERIKKKKKRRIFVIIFLLAGLSLLGYWQRSNLFGESENDIAKTEKQKTENSKPTDKINNTSTIKQNTETTKKEEIQNTTDKPVNDELNEDRSVVDKKEVIVSKNEINKPKKSKNEIKVKPAPQKTKIDDKPEFSIAIVSANSKKKNTIIDDGKTKDVPEVKTNPETIVKQEDAKQPEVKPLENKIDSAKAQITEQEKNVTEKTDTLLKANEATSPSTPIVKKDSSTKKWKWGLHITPGISSLSDHGSSQISTGRFNYQSSAGSGTAIPPGSQKPADVKPGFAFQAGAFAQRQLSSRTSFSLGLQYGYYSNIIHVGNRRDSLINNNQFANVLDANGNNIYNAGGDTIKYTNQYHFIELPLSFQWQLNKNKTRPFIWSTGFTIGQLIASNA
ncbi:MAG TPA: hypothetical protein VGQ04_19075, partial [Chitinophagaceae bacterium]|nr:hypothetical protein [Chitinophagaceae bacterium]